MTTVSRDAGSEDPPVAVDAASGYLVAPVRAEIHPQTAGQIVRMPVDEGTSVHKGDLLAELYHDDIAALLQEADAKYSLARLERERLSGLLADDMVSRADFDRSKSAEEVALAELKLAQCNLEKTKIVAPFDGVVTVKSARLGEWVDPKIMIVALADRTTLEAEVDVNEPKLGPLREGMAAEIRVEAVPEKAYRGRLRLIVPSSNRQKGTVLVKIALLDPDDRLMPDMAVRASFLAEPRGPGAGGTNP